MTEWKRYTLFISICLICILPSAVRSAGLFEDIAGLSAFLLSPRESSVTSKMIYAEDELEKASLYVLSANYPMKTRLFLQAEQPYITVSSGREIASGFGDFRVRLRGLLHARPGFGLYFLGGFRSGSGTRVVFPYASGSIDAEAGLAVVDTMSVLSWWGAVTGATVWRGPEEYNDRQSHQNYAALQAGVVLPLHPRLDLGLMGAGYILQSGAAREIYAARLEYRPYQVVRLFGSVSAEAGKTEERVDDYSVLMGIRVLYR